MWVAGLSFQMHLTVFPTISSFQEWILSQKSLFHFLNKNLGSSFFLDNSYGELWIVAICDAIHRGQLSPSPEFCLSLNGLQQCTMSLPFEDTTSNKVIHMARG